MKNHDLDLYRAYQARTRQEYLEKHRTSRILTRVVAVAALALAVCVAALQLQYTYLVLLNKAYAGATSSEVESVYQQRLAVQSQYNTLKAENDTIDGLIQTVKGLQGPSGADYRSITAALAAHSGTLTGLNYGSGNYAVTAAFPAASNVPACAKALSGTGRFVAVDYNQWSTDQAGVVTAQFYCYLTAETNTEGSEAQ